MTRTWPARSPTPTWRAARSTSSRSRATRSPKPSKRTMADPKRDLEDGLRFSHELYEGARKDVFEVAVSVLALLEEMTDQGLVRDDAVAARMKAKQEAELQRLDLHNHVMIEERKDKYAITEMPD